MTREEIHQIARKWRVTYDNSTELYIYDMLVSVIKETLATEKKSKKSKLNKLKKIT